MKVPANSNATLGDRFRFLSRAWIAIPLFAFAFIVWTSSVGIKRVEYVSGLAGSSESLASVSTSADQTGWWPRLIVPEHDNTSYEWLDQTRQMFASREWRLRHVDYENSPFGHEVLATSPYRWWLGLVAWFDHILSGRPIDQSVEQAALLADPLLHLLLLAGTTIFVMWQFGVFPAALLSVCVAVLYPLASDFIAGAPNDHGLAQAFVLWSVLPLVAGARALNSAAAGAGSQAWRWFFAAGVTGAVGLWISAVTLVPILIGIAIGGVIAAWASRDDAAGSLVAKAGIAPWQAWALGGAATTLGACLIEYYPAHMAYWELRVIHPLYGLAWLGGGGALTQSAAWIQKGRPRRNLSEIGIFVLAAAAIAAVPFAMWRTHSFGFLTVDLPGLRLARLPDSPSTSNTLAWIKADGFTSIVWATLLPLCLVFPATWLLLRRRSGPAPRAAIAVALGPVLVALGFACRQLSWWNGLDGALLALLVAATSALGEKRIHRFARWTWSASVALALLPSAILVIPRENPGKKNTLDQTEVLGLIERDLARWMATHTEAGEAVVLAPPDETMTMYYYGGMRGVVTPGWENRSGLGAAIRIASASTPEEARDLIAKRGVTHIVIPQWDPYFDIYAQLGLGRLEGSFIDRLHHWDLPPWLRPVPYLLPTIGGFEGQSIAVFEVIDEQDNATAEARLAEYFVEMGRLDLAASAAKTLRRFPGDLGALVAQAQIEKALGDADGFARSVDLLMPRLSSRADRTLPWDRRLSLAVVLALGQHMEQAGMEVRQCLATVDEKRLRSLSTGSLYRLEVLSKATGHAIADPRLRKLALDLLPQFLRVRAEQ